MATKRTEGGRSPSAPTDRGDDARQNLGIQRPPAEVLHAAELEILREQDAGPRPPGWRLSPRAVRTFILGDESIGVRRKFVGNPALVDRAMVALATNRG